MLQQIRELYVHATPERIFLLFTGGGVWDEGFHVCLGFVRVGVTLQCK